MTKEELTARIARASERWPDLNGQELEHLRAYLRHMSEDAQFDALVAAFVDPPPNAYLAQEYAGRLLEAMKPRCPIAPDEFLPLVLPRWDRSIEQLPAYLNASFGRQEVLDALARVDEAGTVKPEITNTVRFWLRSPRRPG